ncbi:MAG: formyltetrahydrofolate deformylase [Frankiales bacterium]|nr:formyltetrahydrofolate deformylase [Frankiales bacterium]
MTAPSPSERSAFVPAPPPGRRTAVLLLTCPDARGIVAAVAAFLSGHGANIVDVEQHTDADEGLFFQRVEFALDGFDLADDDVLPAFREVSEPFAMEVELRFPERVPRVAVLVSGQDHCLLDLLSRARTGERVGDVVVVVSNHPDHQASCDFFGVPFHHLPVDGPGGKPAQEQALVALLERERVELVVLARYMQVLGPDVVGRYPHRILNIHHSLLPAFVGAKPYHRAHARGVKVIGATAHYATVELDQGPILVQDVAAVTHRDSVEDLVARGRDLEALVLARAVKLHVAAKVLVHGGRAVVFG